MTLNSPRPTISCFPWFLFSSAEHLEIGAVFGFHGQFCIAIVLTLWVAFNSYTSPRILSRNAEPPWKLLLWSEPPAEILHLSSIGS